MAAKVVTREFNRTYAEAVQGEYGRVRQSNNILDERLQAGVQFSWTRSGTDLIYTRPGEALGSQIRFFDHVFDIPRRYQKLKDAALELESPGVTVTTTLSGLYVVQGRVKGVVEEFPAEDGWYLVDAKGIPQGKQVSDRDPNARYSWRRNIGEDEEGNGYIGSAARCSRDRRRVVLAVPPFDRLGVEYEIRPGSARTQAAMQAAAQVSREPRLAVDAVLRSRGPAEDVVARLAEVAESGIGVSKEDVKKLQRYLTDTGRLEI